MDMWDSDSDEDVVGTFALHDAAEAGDVELLRTLITGAADGGGGGGDVEFDPARADAPRPGVDLDDRDGDGCTPLHVALLAGHLDAVHLLLRAGADPSMGVEGSPSLHLAVACGSLAGRAGGAAAAAAALVSAGASPYARDDGGRTPLHWAAHHGLEACASVLLQGAAAEAARVVAAAAEAAAADAAAAAAAGADAAPPAPPAAVPPPLTDIADRQGNTPLHLAAKAGQDGAVAQLLAAAGASAAAAARAKNKAGLTPLALAAAAGAGPAAALLLAAAPDAAGVACKRGRTPGAWAVVKGAAALAAALDAGDPRAAAAAPAPTSGRPPLLVLAPDECLAHRTAPEPILRAGPDPPPENVARLAVLTSPRAGVLRSPDFEGVLAWRTAPRRASAADVLRVHEWSYVRRLQAACAAIPDDPAAVGHLDGDTAVCAASFDAALVAAGAVCDAVDAVCSGAATAAFCAVRPPGHHAGPTGVTPCANDPAGSHGFCLLNNVAIGAAYALATKADVARVAILDFDVHHGNGTQACVAGVVPSLDRIPFSTPYCDGSVAVPTYKPWRGWDDAGRVLFASVQGYGHKEPSGAAGWVYPGSGGTCDTLAPGAGGGGGAEEAGDGPLVEDPDGEFAPDPSAEAPPPHSGPRIINVGMGPGPDAAKWRRAWRDKILPAVVNFRPSLILVSAGFDAHKKDDINFRYCGVTERDYEWLSGAIAGAAAAAGCGGRVVSALEGGYRIQGGPVSAFARSVAAHVRGLVEGGAGAPWDGRDAAWERARERAKREEAAAARAAALAEAEAAAGAAAAAAAGGGGGASTEAAAPPPAAAAPPAADSDGDGEDGGGRGKRRRRGGGVDYVALNAQLEAEKAAASAGKGG